MPRPVITTTNTLDLVRACPKTSGKSTGGIVNCVQPDAVINRTKGHLDQVQSQGPGERAPRRLREVPPRPGQRIVGAHGGEGSMRGGTRPLGGARDGEERQAHRDCVLPGRRGHRRAAGATPSTSLTLREWNRARVLGCTGDVTPSGNVKELGVPRESGWTGNGRELEAAQMKEAPSLGVGESALTPSSLLAAGSCAGSGTRVKHLAQVRRAPWEGSAVSAVARSVLFDARPETRTPKCSSVWSAVHPCRRQFMMRWLVRGDGSDRSWAVALRPESTADPGAAPRLVVATGRHVGRRLDGHSGGPRRLHHRPEVSSGFLSSDGSNDGGYAAARRLPRHLPRPAGCQPMHRAPTRPLGGRGAHRAARRRRWSGPARTR